MRSWSGLIDRSAVATMYHVGLVFHAGFETLWVNESVEIGACDIAMYGDSVGGRSATHATGRCLWRSRPGPSFSGVAAWHGLERSPPVDGDVSDSFPARHARKLST